MSVFSGYPTCAQSCLVSAVTSATTCSVADATCICNNQSAISAAASSCLVQSCSASDIATAQYLGASTCATVTSSLATARSTNASTPTSISTPSSTQASITNDGSTSITNAATGSSTATKAPSQTSLAADTQSASSSSLSGGAIGGIVAGGVIILVLVAVGLYIFFRRRRPGDLAQDGKHAAIYDEPVTEAGKQSYSNKQELPGSVGSHFGGAPYAGKPELEASENANNSTRAELGEQTGTTHQPAMAELPYWGANPAASRETPEGEQQGGWTSPYYDWSKLNPEPAPSYQPAALQTPAELQSNTQTQSDAQRGPTQSENTPEPQIPGSSSGRSLEQLLEDQARVKNEAAILKKLQALSEEERRIQEEIQRFGGRAEGRYEM